MQDLTLGYTFIYVQQSKNVLLSKRAERPEQRLGRPWAGKDVELYLWR
jgi:hypothetical protein